MLPLADLVRRVAWDVEIEIVGGRARAAGLWCVELDDVGGMRSGRGARGGSANCTVLRMRRGLGIREVASSAGASVVLSLLALLLLESEEAEPMEERSVVGYEGEGNRESEGGVIVWMLGSKTEPASERAGDEEEMLS